MFMCSTSFLLNICAYLLVLKQFLGGLDILLLL